MTYATIQELDSKLIATMLKEMDNDIAVRFVASAFSLNKRKIEDAFQLACREMSIRIEAEQKEAAEAKKRLQEETTLPQKAVEKKLQIAGAGDYDETPDSIDRAKAEALTELLEKALSGFGVLLKKKDEKK